MTLSASRFRLIVLPALFVAVAAARPAGAEEVMKASARPAAPPAPPGSGAAAFDRIKALAGDWIDVDGAMGMKDQVAVTYRVTGAGSAVVETVFVGSPHEMVSVYHRDGNDLVMTHYCAAGNQPRMRAKKVTGNVVALEFDGGTNIDPARDEYMRSVRLELVSNDEIQQEWVRWTAGKPDGHAPKFHLRRRKA